jgi:hypothetical protein
MDRTQRLQGNKAKGTRIRRKGTNDNSGVEGRNKPLAGTRSRTKKHWRRDYISDRKQQHGGMSEGRQHGDAMDNKHTWRHDKAWMKVT